MTITPEEHDYIGAVIAADVDTRRAKTIPIPSQGSDIIEAWKASQAFAAYGDQEDIRETFFMGWNAGVGEIDRVRKECQALQERLNVAGQCSSDSLKLIGEIASSGDWYTSALEFDRDVDGSALGDKVYAHLAQFSPAEIGDKP